MKIKKELKPLFVNLKRLNFTRYVITDEFALTIAELDYDEKWSEIVNSKPRAQNTEEYKDLADNCFIDLMEYVYEKHHFSFHKFILPVIRHFVKWKDSDFEKHDYSLLREPLLKSGIAASNVDKLFLEIAPPKKTELKSEGKTPFDTSKIFLVHGHDHHVLLEVERVVGKLGLIPIILRDQPNLGNTLIEKFEKNSNVGFAIILLTDDDLGRSKNEPELKKRARQNVILELGYFFGKLGRGRVLSLLADGIESPSDISGIAYTQIDSAGKWKFEIVRELKAAGFNVDANKLI